MKNILTSSMMVAMLLLGGAGVALVSGQSVAAVDCTQSPDKETAACQVQAGVNKAGGSANSGTDLTTFIQTIINVLLFIIGAVAVIMIIIGGLRYVTSNGDQTHVKGAKDTILYAVVGLIVAILAYAIVQFVVSKVV